MEGEQAFDAALSEAIAARRQHIENEELPQLKELFRVFHASFKGLHGILLRKGLVQEDPYKSEQKLSEIKPPEDDSYLESERDVVLGIRLDAFDNTLEFLNNYYEFRIDAIGFKELRELNDLVKYISWEQLSSTAAKPTTRGIGDLLARTRAGSDTLSSGVMSDARGQLTKYSKLIAEKLKVIGTFKREEYKHMIRTEVLPRVPDASSLVPDDPATITMMRDAFRESGLAGHFVPELASETLREECSPQASQYHDEALGRLQVVQKKKKVARPKESLQSILISAIRSLAACSRSLSTCVEHLEGNAEVLNSRQRSLGERFRAWVDRVVNRRPQEATYTVEYLDETTGAHQSEAITFESFMESVAKKSRLYGAFLAKSGVSWTKLQAASEEQLYQFINKELGECHLIHRRCQALDIYFKASATKEERTKLRGVKIELTTIRNSIVKANQLKHEYVAKKDEVEQMKKLGISEEQLD